MSSENGTANISAPSPPDSNKRSKISYTREFLLSFSKADSCNVVKLPNEVQLSISCAFEDSPGILPPPTCVPDSGFQKSMPKKISPKDVVIDSVNHQLHRTVEPYRPPCRNKALPPSTRDTNVLLNGDTSGSSEGTIQKAGHVRWRKDKVRDAEEDKGHSRQNIGSKDSSEKFLMSTATGNSNTLQFTSNVINEQSEVSSKPSQIQGAVRSNAVHPSTLLETTKNCSIQRQQVQDLITDKTVIPWQSSGNYICRSCHLPMLDIGQLMESQEYSNFDAEHPVGTCDIMESVRRPTSFYNKENCGNLKKSLCQVAYEQGIMDSQLSNLSLQDVKQAISVIPKQNPSSPDFQFQEELEINSFCSSLDGESNSSSEVCWPDEDSLTAFDESFLMPDLENLAVGDSFMSNPESGPNEADDGFSPRFFEMIEKLVESVLNDDSTAAPHLDDPIVHHGAGLDDFYHPMHAQQSYPQFCSNQLNPRRDQQSHNSFQERFIGSPTFSLFSYSVPSSSIPPPFPLCHDDLRGFDHEVSQLKFQQMINPSKLNLSSSSSESQSGVPVPPHVLARRITSCTQKLNSMQGCLGYQEESRYGGVIRSNLDLHGDSARHWNPYVGGFQ